MRARQGTASRPRSQMGYAMFGLNDKKRASVPTNSAAPALDKPAPKDVPSILSDGLTIVGNLTSDGEIQIDGAVDGDIVARHLTVGETARVTGHIEADTVVIKGAVNGLIQADSVTLSRTANVVGDIVHVDLSIETGALLEGHCRRRPPSEEPAAQAPATKLEPPKPPRNDAAPAALPKAAAG